MQIQESRIFGDFYLRIMNRREYPAYEIQVKKLVLEKREKGYFARTIQSENRVIHINYYLSKSLDTLFVLTAHIERRGEPRPKETEALKAFIEDIERRGNAERPWGGVK